MKRALDALARLDLLVFDFDGVMTTNTVYLMADGEEMVRCHRGDGLGIDKLRQRGVPMLILSTEENPIVQARARKLRMDCRHGLKDKASALGELLRSRHLDARHVIYVGNDENDAGCLALVGLPVVVADAHDSVIPLARHQLSRKGGEGAVRELADAIADAIDNGALALGK